MIFFCRTEQRRQKAASTDPLILFSSQYKLRWTRGASNGRIKNVFKKLPCVAHAGQHWAHYGWHIMFYSGEREREKTRKREREHDGDGNMKNQLNICKKGGKEMTQTMAGEDPLVQYGEKKGSLFTWKCHWDQGKMTVWRHGTETSQHQYSYLKLKLFYHSERKPSMSTAQSGKMPIQRTNLVFSPKLQYSNFNCHLTSLALNWFSRDVIHTDIFKTLSEDSLLTQ